MTRPFSQSLLLAAFLTLGAVQGRAQVSDEPIKLKTEIVLLDAQVAEKQTGAVIAGLTRNDFVLYEDGVRQEIEYFSFDQLPLSIILLLDVSPSTRPFIEKIQAGALQALEQLKPADEVAVMYYGGKAHLAQGFTRDRGAIVEAIVASGDKALIQAVAGRGTAIKHGLYGAARAIAELPPSKNRRAIIVITDDISLPFGPSEKETSTLLFESGAVVCGLLVQHTITRITRKMPSLSSVPLFNGGSRINPYVEKTGGDLLQANADNVSEKFAVILNRLRTRYSLGYVPTNPVENGKFRRIRLALAEEARRKTVVIRAREGYFARPRPESR